MKLEMFISIEMNNSCLSIINQNSVKYCKKKDEKFLLIEKERKKDLIGMYRVVH